MDSIAGLPPKQGLYDPRNEHDACGVGFVAHIKGRRSHDIVEKGLTILNNLRHRGATGADQSTSRKVDPRRGGLELGFGEFAITLEAAEIRPGPVTFS